MSPGQTRTEYGARPNLLNSLLLPVPIALRSETVMTTKVSLVMNLDVQTPALFLEALDHFTDPVDVSQLRLAIVFLRCWSKHLYCSAR